MSEPLPIDLNSILYSFLIAFGIGLLLTLAMLAWVISRVRKIHIPPDADFMTTLRHTPLSVVILLDLMDLTLDFLSAPFAWVLLGYLDLQSLRAVTVVESVIPGTQFLPTLTAAWFFARFVDPKRKVSGASPPTTIGRLPPANPGGR
jgi:hypothetical protein